MAVTNDGRGIGEHDWHSRDYVAWWITRALSRDAERRQRLREMLAATNIAVDAGPSVLDVGGGYGVVSEEVLAAFPRAHVTLQDYSEPMLAAARERLASYAQRIAFVHADLTDSAWVRRVGGPFDLAVSAIVIHNLRDVGAIAAAYRGVAEALKPGGVFLDYDLFFDEIGGTARHVELLRDAGFAQVDCLWQKPPLATLRAVR
ncbi:MAG TPA: class I SAM-dependent methyltransferase [Stellaceae bacterium]|jgi:ubiquinone/menaquinone biosynthesis C-methylase UbiE|nr:class I SAM-dependent methyltransferase [Stellaceae bacterium]